MPFSGEDLKSLVEQYANEHFGENHGVDLSDVLKKATDFASYRGWSFSSILTQGVKDLVFGIQVSKPIVVDDRPAVPFSPAVTDAIAAETASEHETDWGDVAPTDPDPTPPEPGRLFGKVSLKKKK